MKLLRRSRTEQRSSCVAAQAQQYVDSGQPEALIDTAYPIPLLVTAAVFIEKYGPSGAL